MLLRFRLTLRQGQLKEQILLEQLEGLHPLKVLQSLRHLVCQSSPASFPLGQELIFCLRLGHLIDRIHIPAGFSLEGLLQKGRRTLRLPGEDQFLRQAHLFCRD